MQKVRNSLSAHHGPRRRLKSRAAFTLVEVMISFTIMVAVLCGSLTAMQSGYKAIDTARSSTLAAQIMQSQIERLRLMSWPDIVAEQTTRGHDFEIDIVDEELVPDMAADVAARFTLKQTIQDVSSTRTGIKNVSLTVTWTGVGGTSQSRTFATRYAQNGLYDYYYSIR